jgi:HAD superfamily hydrolase (TIGR01509 family)
VTAEERAPARGHIRAPRSIDAVIFDLDGTIIDTQHNYRLSDAEFLRRHNLPDDDEMLDRMTGRGNRMIHKLLVEEFGFSRGLEEMLDEKVRIYLDMGTDNVVVFPEMLRLIEALRARGVPLAVASGSTRQIIDRMLDAFDLVAYFDATVSADEIGSGKPEPDVFLEAARLLGTPPEACLVVEDAAPGIEAARAAGMLSVAVPFKSEPPLPPPFHQADLLFPGGMESFRADAVLSWMGL